MHCLILESSITDYMTAQARGAPRSNATAKDSEWVRTRQALEKDKPQDVNEVMLHHAAGICIA